MARFKVLAAKYKFYWFTALMFLTGIMWMVIGIRLPWHISLLILMVAIYSDMLTTYLCTHLSGREGNPVVAFMFKRISIWGTFMLSACIWCLYIYFMWMRSLESVQTAMAITYWWVPLNNVLVLRRLRKECRN